ncbi:MAG: hypothetical protein N2321_12655 [Melioribacteraceae bacterium]|nr:hypothetical protein [Melioribacteraceae bacterium]
MKSSILIKELEKIPLKKEHKHYSFQSIAKEMFQIHCDYFVIETVVGLESAFSTIFTERNIPDDLQQAYNTAFSNVSMDQSLFERYSEMVDKSPESVSSFVGTIKGKLFELRLPDLLENQFPDYSFEIASDPTQPVWDIIGNSSRGESILIQAKMGGSGYVSDVLERMQDNPDVLFATSNEIRDSILSSHPELADQFVNVDLSNYDFTAEVNHDLELLADNLGIDIPDSIGEIIPYLSEIILGIRLIKDLISVQRDFKSVSVADKTKLSAVKTIVLLSRFGVSIVCTTVCSSGGAAAGSIFPGPGTLIGGIGGAIAGAFMASKLNKHLKPYYMEFALGLTGLTNDDLFYFRNKNTIDRIGFSFYEFSNDIRNKLSFNA